jgi:hypothetical protein
MKNRSFDLKRDEGMALGIARNLARTHYRFHPEPGRPLDEVDARLRERGLGELVPVALDAYAAEWSRLMFDRSR